MTDTPPEPPKRDWRTLPIVLALIIAQLAAFIAVAEHAKRGR